MQKKNLEPFNENIFLVSLHPLNDCYFQLLSNTHLSTILCSKLLDYGYMLLYTAISCIIVHSDVVNNSSTMSVLIEEKWDLGS